MRVKDFYYIDIFSCSGCRKCVQLCPFESIKELERVIQIDLEKCQKCGLCSLICPLDSIVSTADLEIPS